MESVAILTPPSTGLSGILLSVGTYSIANASFNVICEDKTLAIFLLTVF